MGFWHQLSLDIFNNIFPITHLPNSVLLFSKFQLGLKYITKLNNFLYIKLLRSFYREEKNKNRSQTHFFSRMAHDFKIFIPFSSQGLHRFYIWQGWSFFSGVSVQSGPDHSSICQDTLLRLGLVPPSAKSFGFRV